MPRYWAYGNKCQMNTFFEEFQLPGTAGTDIHDVTDRVAEAVAQNGVDNGVAVVFTPGSTAAVTAIEYESGVLQDLVDVLQKLAPSEGHYAHNARWGDGNGYSHVRSALLGPSMSIPIIDGKLTLGTWQQIVVCDFDNRPRKRRVVIQLLGSNG